MYSQEETISAVLAFYQQIIKHPYLDDSALKLPPKDGWTNIDVPALRAMGKNETVIDLIRHLPYLRDDDGDEESLTVENEMIPSCYAGGRWSYHSTMEEVISIPGHCFLLTEAFDKHAYSLILDTERGTITKYSICSGSPTPEYTHEEVEAVPFPEKWKLCSRIPIKEFFERWTKCYEKLIWMLSLNVTPIPVKGKFWSRASYPREVNELLEIDGFVEWIPQNKKSEYEDQRLRDTKLVYDLYLQHGWPDNFDKTECRRKLWILSRKIDRRERREFRRMNNERIREEHAQREDEEFFSETESDSDSGNENDDDDIPDPNAPKVRKATGGVPPRKATGGLPSRKPALVVDKNAD